MDNDATNSVMVPDVRGISYFLNISYNQEGKLCWRAKNMPIIVRQRDSDFLGILLALREEIK